MLAAKTLVSLHFFAQAHLSLRFSTMRHIENIYFFEVNTKYISTSTSTSIWYTLPSHLTVIARVGCGFKNKEKWK